MGRWDAATPYHRRSMASSQRPTPPSGGRPKKDLLSLFREEAERSSRSASPAQRGAEDGRGPPSETVGQLAQRIKLRLDDLGEVRVRGEVSNLVDKGHWYFSLKDADAVLSCAMWQEQTRRVGFTPREGDAVTAVGTVSFYPKQGRTQLYVRSLERIGAGSLQEAYEALCRELRGLGYFAEERKLPLPWFPRRIAIVTSATGAAIHDCLRTAAHRCPAVGIVAVDVKVQGTGAAEEVARAIRALEAARDRLGIDAILVTRGGGSIEDLWAFNERVVADAVFARRHLPIVAAIGHESDTTIIELVADRRASTPTQAVMVLTPDAADLGEQLDEMLDRLDGAVRRALRERRRYLDALARHPFLRSPLAAITSRRGDVEDAALRLRRAVERRHAELRRALEMRASRLGARRPDLVVARERDRLRGASEWLVRAVERRVERTKDRVVALERQLQAIAPDAVLARGFSIAFVRAEDGTKRLVRSVADAQDGALLETIVVDGAIRSRVGSAESARRPLPRAQPSSEVGDAGLFGGST
jgi:exodeoxyribonuclease VII large subunit